MIVVDHGSTDETRIGLGNEFPGTIHLPGTTDMWWTAATNLGIREALQRGATDIMLMNNDCYVEDGTIACLKEHQASTGEAVIAPVQRSLQTGGILTRRMTTCFLLGFPTLLLPGRSLYRPDEHRLLPTRLIIGGRGVLFPVSVLEKTGLLNETDLPHYGSDHDFYLRCRKLGIPLYIASDAAVDIDDTTTTLATNFGQMPLARFLAHMHRTALAPKPAGADRAVQAALPDSRPLPARCGTEPAALYTDVCRCPSHACNRAEVTVMRPQPETGAPGSFFYCMQPGAASTIDHLADASYYPRVTHPGGQCCRIARLHRRNRALPGRTALLSRGYQYDFSASSPYVYDVENRERKARTMAAVLEDFFPGPLDGYDLLNVGGSAGIIDN